MGVARPATEAMSEAADRARARARARADWEAILADGGYEAVIGNWLYEALGEYIKALEVGRQPDTSLIVERLLTALGYLAACVVVLEARPPG